MTPEQRARLPRYAQDEIEALERRTREAEAGAERARLATAPTETDTVIDDFVREGEIGLPPGARVVFVLGRYGGEGLAAGRPSDYIAVRVKGGVVEVHASRPVVTRHHSSNLFSLGLEER